jgi:PAS domain S-box-containing protein
MKVLYIGRERTDAEAVATALRRLDLNAAISWTARLEPALKWLDANPDLAALIADAQIDEGKWPSILTHVRSLAGHPAVVVIVPDGTARDSVHAEADGYIPRDQSLLRDLPIVVSRAMGRAARVALEQKLAHAAAALQDAEQRHRAAIATADQQLAERNTKYEIGMAQAAATWEMVDEQLRAAAREVEHARQDQASAAADVDRLSRRESELLSQLGDAAADVERLATREAELNSRLADVLASRTDLERRSAAAEAAFAEFVARATHERLVASKTAAGREAELDGQIRRERATRTTLEQAVVDAEIALRDAQQRHDAAVATATTELTERQARFDRQLSQIAAQRDRLREQLNETEVTLKQVGRGYQSAAADIEHLTQREAELTSLLADVQAARQTLDQQLADATSAIRQAAMREAALDEQIQRERATRDAHALEREAQFEVQIAQHRLDHESRLTDVHEQLRQLRDTLAASAEDLEASRAESHRLFEQAGLAMFRCTRDGALIDANRACTTLVGRRIDELRGAHFAAAVFDAPNALSWLIERCLSTRAKEALETTWLRNDGGRLFVRLSARLSAPDVIEIVGEDLTRLRVLEERLGQAHRMEAVGRLASEVAVTCSTLLTGIHRKGREWIKATGVDADSRRHGEQLLEDMRRATGLLQQFAACGEEQQTRSPMLVDLNTLIHDLEPVLKRVAGDDVDVQLQDMPLPLNVDVGTERVERLLVNLASYGRERMPFGGQLRIELGKIVVDRHFAAKHPNVRLGLHALITVTEIRRAAQTDKVLQPRDRTMPDSSHGRASLTPGVDFGTLQELVSECGGHLWMKVQPRGEMVAKIRLPLLSPQHQTPPRTLVARGGRARPTTRWFHS